MTARITFPDPPIGMDAAADLLGVSRRTLTESLKRLPHYERRGSRKVFYPEHIAALRQGMNSCASNSNGSTAGLMSTARAPMAAGSDALSKLEILARQQKQKQR